MLLLLFACGEADEPTPSVAPGAAAEAPAAAPAAPALERSPPLQARGGTSGAGAERMFDNDPRTGWSPVGDSNAEGVLLRLAREHDKGVEGMEVVLCPDSAAASLQVYVNGSVVGNLRLGPGEGDEVRFQPSSTRSLFIKIRNAEGPVCIAEVGLIVDGEGTIPEPPRAVAGKLSVSSQLEPADAYHADYLFDSRDDFGWVEGAPGSGKGEALTVSFAQAQTLSGLEVWNGYQRSMDHFTKNAKVKRLQVHADGEPIFEPLGLTDVTGPQALSFPEPLTARELRLEVVEVSPGTKYEDLVISELRFVDAQGSFGLAVDLDARAQALKTQLVGSPLESVLDRSFQSVCDGPYIGSRELKLRSNNSFVWYDESEDLEEVFDGAWVPTRASSGELKLYGRIHRVQTVYVAYGEGETSDTTRIGGGSVTVTRAGDLSPSDWDEQVGQLQSGAAELRFECAPPHAEAVRRGLVLVQGKPFVDLMSPLGG